MLMSMPIDPLISALRDELSQYGEMLALLDQQQETIVERRTDDLLHTTEAINSQGDVVQEVRRQREERQRHLAREWRQPETTSLGVLTRVAPTEYRPLFEALVRENNQLLFRIQQRVRQNQLMLSQVIELSQRLINSLFPGNTPVYAESGGLRSTPSRSMALYEAVG